MTLRSALNRAGRWLADAVCRGRMPWLAGGMWLTLILFDVLWCADTSFRAMSDVELYVSSMAAAMLLTLPYKLSRRLWVHITLMALLDALLMANLMYCRTYFDAIPLSGYMMAGNLSDFGDSVVSSLRPGDFLLPLVTLLTWLCARRRPPLERSRRSLTAFISLTGLLCLAAAVIAQCRGGMCRHIDKLTNSCYYHSAPMPIYTVFGYLAWQAIQTPPEYSESIGTDIEAWLADHQHLAQYTPLPDSIAGRRNLVIILCESLESWPVGLTVEGCELTPYLNSLVGRPDALYAPNVLTQVDKGRSIDCQLLVNAGMHPTYNSVYSMRYPDNRYLTLNQAVTADGGRSYLLTPDKPVTWNTAPIARAFGIDTLISQGDYIKDETIGHPAKLSDGSFMRQSVAKMQSGQVWPEGETAFVMLITYSGHFPFKIPDHLNSLSLSGEWPERLADYMRMCHYVDAQLRTMVEYIESRSDAAETMIVITGDHEGLAGDRAALADGGPGRGLVSSGQFTPLLVLNSPVAGRYDNVLGQVDIYTTLLNLMHLDNWSWKGMGRSIVGANPPRHAIAGMTGEVAGDTLDVSAELLRHQRDARRISDMIITYDYLRRR